MKNNKIKIYNKSEIKNSSDQTMGVISSGCCNEDSGR